MSVDQQWDEIHRRYDPAFPKQRGRISILTNNDCLREGMHGFRDPAVTDPSRNNEYTEDAEFLDHLTTMFLSSALADHRTTQDMLSLIARDDGLLGRSVREHSPTFVTIGLLSRSASLLYG